MLNAEQFGRYRLVRKLASGAVSEVFLADAVGPVFGKPLVIKRILPEVSANPEFVRPFVREAGLAAQLIHPHLAQVFDFGELDGSCYLAMELVDGPGLRSLIPSAPPGPRSLALAAKIICGACEALTCAHELADPKTGVPHGLIHGAVSADHVLLDRNGRVKVIDFGVTRLASGAGNVKRKAVYMPLEQLLAEADARADVYALGVILYEWAAGAPPYPQLPEPQLIDAIINTAPVPLLVRRPDVPIEYAMLVDKAIAREPEARFQTCQELAVALKAFIAGTGERVGSAQLAQLVDPSAPASSPSGIAPRASSASGIAPRSSPSGIAPRASSASGIAPRSSPSGIAPRAERPAAPAPLPRPPPSAPSVSSAALSSAGPQLAPPAPIATSRALPPVPPAQTNAPAVRTGEAGAPVAAPAEFEPVRPEVERPQATQLLVRFAQSAALLLRADPGGRGRLGERIVGVVEALLLTESYGPLAQLLAALEGAAGESNEHRWVLETARAAFATAEQAQRLGARLREAVPTDVEGLGALLPLFGGEFALQWIAITEAMELPGSREALLSALAGLASKNPEPFLARLQVKRPRHLPEFVYMLEKGRASERQAAFREMMARPDPVRRRDVMTGMARARSDDAFQLLVQSLREPDEALRIHAIQLLGKYFPDRVFGLMEPLLAPSSSPARAPAERLAIWRAIGVSTQPEAFNAVRDVLKQKASLLNRGRVEALKLEALEALALMTSAQGLELMQATADDRAELDLVRASAKRLLLGRELEQPHSTAGESRRWERSPSTYRDVLLDLSALAHAARLIDARSPLLDIAFTRLRTRIQALLKSDPRATVVVKGGQVTVNGRAVGQGSADPEMERVIRGLVSRGIGGFTISDRAVAIGELQQLVRWLAGGAAAEGVLTPSIERVLANGVAGPTGR